jgi:hypothetical protein
MPLLNLVNSCCRLDDGGEALKQLHLLPVKLRMQFNLLYLTYKAPTTIDNLKKNIHP